jgi:hypothetical protein
LLKEYCNRLIWDDGGYKLVNQGISLGSSLSPLMGAIYLQKLDKAMSSQKVFYKRFMDDWIVLAKTRWQLRKVIKITEQILEDLKLKKHPEKTFIGRIEKGFEFLGYLFKPESLQVSVTTVKRAITKATQLYEQGESKQRIEKYWERWQRWASSGLNGIELRWDFMSEGFWQDVLLGS